MNRYLLDTCSFLWMSQNPSLLSDRALEVLESPDSILLISPVVTWEVAIKLDTKRNNIKLNMDLGAFISSAIKDYDLQVLPLNINHSIGVRELPFHHKCPFDRLLISISRYEKSPIISCDEKFQAYDVTTIW
jgi:PIN domain nuclease of toxin-antitoxin system